MPFYSVSCTHTTFSHGFPLDFSSSDSTLVNVAFAVLIFLVLFLVSKSKLYKNNLRVKLGLAFSFAFVYLSFIFTQIDYIVLGFPTSSIMEKGIALNQALLLPAIPVIILFSKGIKLFTDIPRNNFILLFFFYFFFGFLLYWLIIRLIALFQYLIESIKNGCVKKISQKIKNLPIDIYYVFNFSNYFWFV